MNMLKIKDSDTIKYEACQNDVSLSKILEIYNLSFFDIGLFFIDKNIAEIINDNVDNYPINIFYSLQKDEIHQIKVDFTHNKIKEVIRLEKNRLASKA